MKKVILILAALFGIASLAISTWLDVSHGLSIGRSLIVAAANVVALALIIRWNLVRLPPRFYFPVVTTGIGVPELLSAAGYFILACVWTYISGRIAIVTSYTNSQYAVIIVFGPAVFLLIIGTLFFMKSITPRSNAKK